MDISDELLCLFTARVEDRGGSYVIEVPKREVDLGAIEAGDVSRVALLSAPTQQSRPLQNPSQNGDSDESEAPVEEGEVVDVEIEDIGDQGDGIARVGPGYVVIVSDAEKGERVSIKITEVRDNVAFADVVKNYDL